MALKPAEQVETVRQNDITSAIINHYSSYITTHTMNKGTVNYLDNIVSVNIALYITTAIPTSVSELDISSYLPKKPSNNLSNVMCGAGGVKGTVSLNVQGKLKIVSSSDSNNILFASIIYMYD